jgi:Protein of unknown function (DUF3261)
MIRCWLPLLAALLPALLTAGCAAPFFPLPPTVAVPAGKSAAELAGSDWTRLPGRWLLTQSAEFSFHGRKLPMQGLLQLDSGHQAARLIAVNELGIKLFDIEVFARGETVHYLLPDLARYPRLGEAVAASVRRMFLAPRPRADDRLRREATGYELAREENGRSIRFRFGGQQAQLEQIRVMAPGEDWQVGYYDYRSAGEVEYAEKILLEDRVAGYRLRLRVLGMRRSG